MNGRKNNVAARIDGGDFNPRILKMLNETFYSKKPNL